MSHRFGWILAAGLLGLAIPRTASAQLGKLDTKIDTTKPLVSIDKVSPMSCLLAYTPDGKWLIEGGATTSDVTAWDAETGKAVATFKGSRGDWAKDVATNAGGDKIVVGDDRGRVRVFDSESGEELHVFEHAGPVRIVAFANDGKQVVAIAYDRRKDMQVLKVWQTSDGKEVVTGDLAPGNGTISLSDDGKYLVAAGNNTTLRVLDAPTGKELAFIKADPQAYNVLVFNADGKRLAGAGYDGKLTVWDTTTGKALYTIDHDLTGAVYGAAFSPGGGLIALGSAEKVALYDAETGKLYRTFPGRKPNVFKLAFSPDGRRLATTGLSGIKVWSLTD